MIRVETSLSPGDYAAAKIEAGRLGISLAELLRRSLRAILPQNANASWMQFAGMVESGDSNSSRRIDEIAWGDVR
jgi:hypothetical protein